MKHRGPVTPGLYRYQRQQIELAEHEAISEAVRREIARVRAEIVAELERHPI